MNPGIIEGLKRLIPPQRVAISPEELLVYSYDGTLAQALPEAVVSPLTAEEVAAVVKLANRERIPVVPRGGGSGLSGGAVPCQGGIVVNMTLMNKILEIDRGNMLAVVQPGVVNAEFQAEVEKYGLFYPPDPASYRQSTIGGNAATCAGGPRCLKYGVTKDYVLGLQVVLPSGEIIRTGGKMIKSVAGYNLTQLFIGSEGTLGVITELTLRLLPLPPARGTVSAAFARLEDASKTVATILGTGIIPLALEMMDRSVLGCVEEYLHLGLPTEAEAMLIIDLDGETDAVGRQVEAVADLCAQGGASEVRKAHSAAQSEGLWRARRATSGSFGRMRPNKLGEDVSVPRSAIPQMVRRVREIADKYSLPIPLFGHIGDGNLHPNILFDVRDKEEVRRVEQAAVEIFRAAVDLGGTISGEHGIGLLKREFLPLAVDSGAIAVMRQIKAVLDPNGIMNPGKVFPSGA